MEIVIIICTCIFAGFNPKTFSFSRFNCQSTKIVINFFVIEFNWRVKIIIAKDDALKVRKNWSLFSRFDAVEYSFFPSCSCCKTERVETNLVILCKAFWYMIHVYNTKQLRWCLILIKTYCVYFKSFISNLDFKLYIVQNSCIMQN